MVSSISRTVCKGLLVAMAALIAIAIAVLPQSEAQAAGLAAGSSTVTAQSSNTHISSPSNGATFNIGEPINISAYSRIYFFQYGYAVSNYITFKVTKGGKQVFYDYGWYNSAGSYVTTSFTPKEHGKYKIEIAGPSFSKADPKSFSATDSITVTVKGPSFFKTNTPQVRSERFAKNRVKIEWNKLGTGAKIYRATTRNGKYKLIKTTTATSFVDKVNAKSNYFYKVKCYLKYKNKIYQSKFSNAEWKFAKAPAKPTVKTAKKVKKGVKLTWKQPSDCGHFTIWRSIRKAGKYKVVGYVSGNQTCFTDTSTKSGTTYFYKVESDNYLDWSGNILGKLSAPIRVKA